jgi:hypothetical protein
MATDVEEQLKQLDIEMAKAKTQAAKDEIKERQGELKRQLEGSKKSSAVADKPKAPPKK